MGDTTVTNPGVVNVADEAYPIVHDAVGGEETHMGLSIRRDRLGRSTIIGSTDWSSSNLKGDAKQDADLRYAEGFLKAQKEDDARMQKEIAEHDALMKKKI